MAILEEHGAPCDVIEYLRTPPDRATLHRLLQQLKSAPGELVRRDKRFRELGIEEAACASADQVVELLLEHPELMERPVVVRGDSAVIARPPERVLELLD